MKTWRRLAGWIWLAVSGAALAQVAPSADQIARYEGLHAAAGADPNARDAQGRTPLMLARQRGHTAMVTMLERAAAKKT